MWTTKLVYGFRYLSCTEPLKHLGLSTLQNRRLRGDMTETYKMLTL